jgi:NADH-quinone oxidoreductase subunit I
MLKAQTADYHREFVIGWAAIEAKVGVVEAARRSPFAMRLNQAQYGAHGFRHDGPNYIGNDDSYHRICNRKDRQRQQQFGRRSQVGEVGSHNVLNGPRYDETGDKVPSFGETTCQPPTGHRKLQVVCYAHMGMSALLRKIFLLDLLQGLKVTFRYQDPKETYTEQYPLERPQVAERYRGAPRLNVNPDTNETMCIACDLCALACPENLIVVSSARNEHTRRKELTNFTYDLSRCMFCGLCEDACPVDALELTQDFELASYTRQGWIWDRETLEKGPQPTQYKK